MNNNFLNLAVAIILSLAIVFSWQHFFERPRLEKVQAETEFYNKQLRIIQTKQGDHSSVIERDYAIQKDKRVMINTELLSGSISLKGVRFDDIILKKYSQTIDENSPRVVLFSPSVSPESYFAEIGWWSNDKNITYPNASTEWQTDSDEIQSGDVVNLHWISPENVMFKIMISLDNDYLFKITQSIENNSSVPTVTRFYGLINRTYKKNNERIVNILHQGMIGSISGQLQEYSYDSIRDMKKQSFSRDSVNWLGITDKYWLTSFIPDQSQHYSANYNYALRSGIDKYQADFMSNSKLIEPGGSFKLTHHLFVGPKKVDLLDKYAAQYDILLFDRAIDFGWFYLLTKPIFNFMNFFYKYVGNFGISIMIVTVLIKLLMFTLANKSYRSMKNIKRLQPEIERLKELHEHDKPRLNQEIISLYRREKLNPITGCLPLLLQIPVFFSIYKVLYITIEMRHAPFFGWIQDLSAPDPTSVFNLFGLLTFSLPSFLMIGVWPLIMAITMFIQQRMGPTPTDPVQAQMMKLMPVMFLFMFSGFPSGLLIYWSWNNVLSIIQQFYINKLDKN